MEFEIYNTFPSSMATSVVEFLLPIFGYGNYSFSKAVSGWGDSGLETMPGICKDQGLLKGIAFALYSAYDPQIAIFGPIAVDEDSRNNGIGREIAEKVLNRLEEIGAIAIYLGAKEDHPARKLYTKLGFQNYSGVVMRKLFVNSDKFESECYGPSQDLQIRKVSWADYPKFQALISHPCQIKVFDLQNGYFSSRYFKQKKFLGVFPEIMAKHENGETDIRILTSGPKEAIVGVSITQKSKNRDFQEVNLNFFIHDSFLESSNLLLASTIQSRTFLGKSFCAECLSSDAVKRNILKNNHFYQNSEYEMNIPGYGTELVQIFEYKGKSLC